MGTAELRRSINLPLLLLYGVGTIVGGGIYALIGKVAAHAGGATPLALGLTGLLALLSALSFAELSSRFPRSAGEAFYVREGFSRRSLSTVVGWMVILTGVVSAATLSDAIVGFLQDAIQLPTVPGLLLVVLGMGVIAGWGIGSSVGVVVTITVIEVGALVYVVLANGAAFAQLPERWTEMLPSRGAAAGNWTGLFTGAFLAFYAYIGFEDMVNMAEEVKDPRRTLPRAILLSLGLSLLLYVAVGTVAVLTVPLDRLAESRTPMAELVPGDGWWSTRGIWLVSVLTGLNGALVQIIMGARVAYGMARQQQAPAWLGIVNATTRTPLRATALVAAVVLALALWLPLTTLAQITSTIILMVFVLVNLALWRIQARNPDRDSEHLRLPRWLPLTGALASAAVLVARLAQLLGGAI